MDKIIGKLVEFNPSTAEVRMKLLFLSESLVEMLLQSEGQVFKQSWTKGTKKYDETKDGTRKKWFQVLSHILKGSNIPVNEQTLGSFHRDLKESMFDCEEFEVDGKIIHIVPSINSVPDHKVKEATEILIARYSQIGIDFKEII